MWAIDIRVIFFRFVFVFRIFITTKFHHIKGYKFSFQNFFVILNDIASISTLAFIYYQIRKFKISVTKTNTYRSKRTYMITPEAKIYKWQKFDKDFG